MRTLKERNTEIYEAWLAGEELQRLADVYDLDYATISKILCNAREADGLPRYADREEATRLLKWRKRDAEEWSRRSVAASF
jgi:hypothetical protein